MYPTHTPPSSQTTWLGVLCGMACCTGLSTWAQEAPPGTTPLAQEPVAAPWTYSLGLRTDMANLSHPGSMKLRPSLGLRYGRWRIGQTDGTDWHRFGQVLQDNNLTYDVRQDSKWSVSLSGSIINLDNNSHFDALKAGRKTLRAKAGLDYRLPNRWSVGLIATQDLFMRGDGSTLSPVLTYRQPLTDRSTLLLSQSATWGSGPHWQTLQQLNTDGINHSGTGWGSVGTQLAYRYKQSRHWGFFSQLSAQRTLQPIFPNPLSSTPAWTYSGQLGVVYFEH